MKGFSDRFIDFPDYILGITMEIWEGRIGSYCFDCASSAVVEESEIVEIELRKEEYQLEEEE